MRTAPTNWATLMAQPHQMETRVDIGGVSYYGNDGTTGIWSCNTSMMLFEKMSVGNCPSSTINLVLLNPQTIPTMAKMEVYARLTNGTITTAWMRKGVYYIDTREWDAQHEFLTITGYDAMLKAEQPYLTVGDIGQWPKVDTAVVSEVCTRINVELDSRTVLNKGYMVQLPAVSSDGSDSDSVRTVLGYIGAAYGGNWIITEEGKLRLVPLKSSATPIALGTNGVDLQTSPAYDALGIIHLVVSEEAEYTAGTSGREIEIQCPWGTQTMANNLLTALSGYVYQPVVITTAYELDPLAELGDNITFNSFTSVIAQLAQDFCLKYTADITAPNSEELEHEYPYGSKEQREIKREIAKSTASLRVDVDKIISEVNGLAPEYQESTEYKLYDVVFKDGKYYACIVETSSTTWIASEWEEQDSGVMSSIIRQTIGSIELTATAGSNQSTVKISAGGIEVDSAVVKFGHITANSIDAEVSIEAPKIDGGTIYGGEIFATGQGNEYGNTSSFYVADGTVSGTTPKGWLCYDKNGDTESGEARNRVFLHSEPDVAMKIEAGANMSIQAGNRTGHNDSIFIMSNIALGASYGTAPPATAIPNPYTGQLYIQI